MVIKGSKLFSYQKDVVDEVLKDQGTNKKVIVKSRRQVGKSLLICNLLLYFSFNKEGSKNYCLSPTFRQGKKIFKSLAKVLSNWNARGLCKSVNSSDLTIEFTNGSEIIFKSAEQRENLRGETVTGILCIDEFAYIPDEIYDIVRPWTDFHKAVTLCVSTPFIKEGYFWEFFNYGLERLHNMVTIDWADDKYQDDLDKILTPDQLKEYESILPKKVFLTEYMGQFIEGGGMVFEGFKEVAKDAKIGDTDKLFVGIDWSNQKGQDDTVVSFFNQRGQQVKLLCWNDLSPLKQIDVIYKELEPYLSRISVIVCETNSLGSPYTDMLKERLQDSHKKKVVEFNTTNASKNDLVGKMQVALEQQTITLLPIDKQMREFSYYSAEYNIKTKTISYNAPTGLHDDIVMADMFALHGLQNYTNKGVYAIR